MRTSGLASSGGHYLAMAVCDEAGVHPGMKRRWGRQTGRFRRGASSRYSRERASGHERRSSRNRSGLGCRLACPRATAHPARSPHTPSSTMEEFSRMGRKNLLAQKKWPLAQAEVPADKEVQRKP